MLVVTVDARFEVATKLLKWRMPDADMDARSNPIISEI
jgi:hypothetical protein